MIHTNDNYRDRLCSITGRIITSHVGGATMSILLLSALLLLPITTLSNQVAVAQRLLLSPQQPLFPANNLVPLQQQQRQQEIQFLRQQGVHGLLQQSSQPTLSSSINNNNILSTLRQIPGTNTFSPSISPVVPYSSTATVPTATAPTSTITTPSSVLPSSGASLTPFVSTSNQVPFIQGSSTNGFVSLPQCASNTGSAVPQTPNPSALIFQVFASPSNSISQIPNTRTTISTATNNNNVNTPTLIPLAGSFIISNSLGAPSTAGQINTGQISGNTFALQGTLAGSNTIAANPLLGGLGSGGGLCSSTAFNSNSLFPTTASVSNTAFSDFTITGTCGTNTPVAFAVDRVIVGVYTANISCNNIV
jgi:hypothetical protein